jgi:hypothetical protein
VPYAHTIDGVTWRFPDLKTLLARASPFRSGDALAGLAAQSAEERAMPPIGRNMRTRSARRQAAEHARLMPGEQACSQCVEPSPGMRGYFAMWKR